MSTPPLPPVERVCQACNVMEDEKHFLFHCPIIQSLPEYSTFLNMCQQLIYNFIFLTTEDKFVAVMSSTHDVLIFHLAKLLYVAFKSRDISH